MQVSAAAPQREHEQPMSWARATLIAVGFFFMAAILIAQVPGYFFNISTNAKLALMEQGFLALGLVSVGLGVLAFEISFLYDPKPLIPWPLFGLVGAAITAVGGFFIYQVTTGAWHEFLPDAVTSSAVVNGKQTVTTTYWPDPHKAYLFNPIWFQPQSIDLAAVGEIGLFIGLGMLVIALLNPVVLSGRLNGLGRTIITRVCITASLALVAYWLTIYTFAPIVFNPKNFVKGAIGNVMLFAALGLALFALLVWLLPTMVNARAQFMPSVYLHGVVGLLGNIGIPLLVIWAVVYPLVFVIHKVDSQQFWVQCSQVSNIPGSCTFTPFTGYIICAIVFSIPFGLFMMGLYFWSTRRNSIVLAGTFALVWIGLGATVIHVSDPTQTPFGLLIATSIAILAFVWTWGTQREFAPTAAEQLGCVGQWLVLGTLLLIYLMGFSLLSMPSFFEIEALALFYQPGPGGLHDAFWGLLLMGGLAALQFTILTQRRPMSNLRKLSLWSMLGAATLEIIAAIQGFHNNVLVQGVNAMEGSHALFVGAIIFEIIGIALAFYGAVRARGVFSAWPIAIVLSLLVGIGVGVVAYNLPIPYPELVVLGFMLAMVGAAAYDAGGPDPVPVDSYAALLQGPA